MTAPGQPSPPVAPEVQPNFDPVHRFSAWLARVGKAEATIDAYHTDVADLVRAYAPRPVEDLLAADVELYLRARSAAEGWAAPTVRRHLQAIKSFYRYLVSEEGLRAPGPAEALAEPVSEPKAPFVIAEHDVRAIFAYLESRASGEPAARGASGSGRARGPGRATRTSAAARGGGGDATGGAAERMDLALYGLCYHAALLVSEAIGLTTDAVRGGTSVMRLDVVGRRGEESRVTVDGDAARWLAAWLAERPRPKRRAHEPFVFIHPRTRLHTSRQRAWDRLKRIAHAAGLDAATADEIGPHTLRHSYAAHLAARSLGVAELRDALRQRSPRHAAKYLREDRGASDGAPGGGSMPGARRRTAGAEREAGADGGRDREHGRGRGRGRGRGQGRERDG